MIKKLRISNFSSVTHISLNKSENSQYKFWNCNYFYNASKNTFSKFALNPSANGQVNEGNAGFPRKSFKEQ